MASMLILWSLFDFELQFVKWKMLQYVKKNCTVFTMRLLLSKSVVDHFLRLGPLLVAFATVMVTVLNDSHLGRLALILEHGNGVGTCFAFN
eukprot:16199-Amphidinium_carterae.1